LRIGDFFNNIAFAVAARLQRPRPEYRRDGSLKGYVAFSIFLHVLLLVAVVIRLGTDGTLEGLTFNVALAEEAGEPLKTPPSPTDSENLSPDIDPVTAPPGREGPVRGPSFAPDEAAPPLAKTPQQSTGQPSSSSDPKFALREKLVEDSVPPSSDRESVEEGDVSRGSLTPDRNEGEVGRAKAKTVANKTLPPPVEKKSIKGAEVPDPAEKIENIETSPVERGEPEYSELAFRDTTSEEEQDVKPEPYESAGAPPTGSGALPGGSVPSKGEPGGLSRPVDPARGLQALKSSFLNNRMVLTKDKKRYEYNCTIRVNANGRVDPNSIEINGEDPALISVLRTILKFDSSLRFDPARDENGMPIAAPLTFDFWIDYARRDELGAREWIAGYSEHNEED
jgi:hypothetical protein